MNTHREHERERMVANLEAAGIGDARVLEAMKHVPRHAFVPEALHPYAYEDRPLPIGYGQTISQPYIVAKMLEALELDGSERVLDVGTGSGYQAALLSFLARRVDSVEIIPELAHRAREALTQLGIRNVRIVLGNGSVGLPKSAPYDAIVCAAATPVVPRELVHQLADGGRLVLPVGARNAQTLLSVERTGTELHTRDLGACVFVPLVGEDGWPSAGFDRGPSTTL